MHDFSPLYSPFAQTFLVTLLPFLAIIVVWTIVIKGFALWHAARNSQKGWFIAMLIVNSLGILEVVYLIWFRNPSSRSPSSAVSSSPPESK